MTKGVLKYRLGQWQVEHDRTEDAGCLVYYPVDKQCINNCEEGKSVLFDMEYKKGKDNLYWLQPTRIQ